MFMLEAFIVILGELYIFYSRKSMYREEKDTFGPIQVPADKYWGAQTQRSLQNFNIAR